MELKGIHFGLTLLYSYLLPLYSIEEINGGFVFRKVIGFSKGLECVFKESTLETKCKAPIGVNVSQSLLGLDKRRLFREICELVGFKDCFSKHITLIYEPRDKELILYSVYLSRNTDYYINTVRWIRNLVLKESISSSSFILREFNDARMSFKSVFEENLDPLSEAVKLLNIRGIGVKSMKAYLLHAYGLTEHAPIDRHYSRILKAKPIQPNKQMCIARRLQCSECTINCLYGYTTKMLRSLNGIVQSLSYIYGRLKLKRRSALEEIIVPNPSSYIDEFEKLLESISAKFTLKR